MIRYCLHNNVLEERESSCFALEGEITDYICTIGFTPEYQVLLGETPKRVGDEL